MEEVFSVHTDGMGHIILMVNGQECADVLVENESDEAFMTAARYLVSQLPVFLSQ